MPDDEIVADRQQNALTFVVALMNLTGDFNKSSAIRNANNFLASEVCIIGNKHWDRRGAVGSHNYMDVTYEKDIADLYLRYPGYEVVALENTSDATPLHRFRWPQKTIMVFGEEQRGLPDEILVYCDHIVSIATMGTVRSLNVSVASGIAMYDYCNKMLSLI